MAKIALSLSGGGYRAAMYHLGTLSYLNHLKLDDGRTLLDHVSAVSSISGGTLTGLWLILGKCQGKTNEEIIRGLRDLIMEGDVIGRASREFLCGASDNHSLIREMVKIYDEEIFYGATMGDIMDKIDDITIDDFSANATEFNNATEFRFYVGKQTVLPNGKTSESIVGNSFYRIPKDIARQIRLSEVFAASSCFPGGFEALFFPRDFQLYNNPENEEYISKTKPLPLMDGGVVDNQGIEPINLLRKRQGKDIDLFIVSDAGCGKEEPYEFEETSVLDHLTVHRINITLNIILIGLAQFLFWVPRGFWFGFILSLVALFAIMRIATALSTRRLLKKYSAMIPFSFRWKGLLHIPFSKYINLLTSRATSMYALTDKVFMKHIRTLNYNTIYSDPRWQNRSMMSALFELCTGKNWHKHLAADERPLMEPTDAIRQCSDLAAEMGTTLWWSDSDRKRGKPEALIATGQYNICWNLLEFIYRLRRNSENYSKECDIIIGLQEQLEADWKRFKEQPDWLKI